jgi:hypothetical protein
MEYELEILKPGEDSVTCRATTKIPGEPFIVSPKGPIRLTNLYYMNPTVNFHDGFSVTLDRGGGHGFELRVYLDFFEGGAMKTVRWGPTKMFQESMNCYEPNPYRICYYISPDDVLRTVFSSTSQSQDTVFFDDGPDYSQTISGLNSNVRLESTAIDSFLSRYMYVQSPFGYGDNLLMDKIQYTNIEGGIGIFGSIHTSQSLLRIGDCDEFLAGLTNSNVAPVGCEW